MNAPRFSLYSRRRPYPPPQRRSALPEWPLWVPAPKQHSPIASTAEDTTMRLRTACISTTQRKGTAATARRAPIGRTNVATSWPQTEKVRNAKIAPPLRRQLLGLPEWDAPDPPLTTATAIKIGVGDKAGAPSAEPAPIRTQTGSVELASSPATFSGSAHSVESSTNSSASPAQAASRCQTKRSRC